MSDLPPRFQPKKRSQAPGANGARHVAAHDSGNETRFEPVRRPNAPQRQSLLGNSADQDQPRSFAPAQKPAPRQTPPPMARPVNGAAMGAPVAQHPALQPRPVRRRRRRRMSIVLALVLVFLLAWPVGLLVWANSKLTKIDALSGAAATDGTTYLLAGSDSRADGEIPDDTAGQRTDTIILLHRALNGQTSMVSLPRDTYVAIPGYGKNKLNAAYAIGGAPLLVSTVEGLTGMTIDHYVEIGMGGVRQIVDSVGGVHLCLDYDVDDPKSELVWRAGCHDTDGTSALAFARMRYSDPEGDIGRQARQRQVISAVVKKAATPGFIVNPFSQVSTVGAGTKALTVDKSTGIIDLAWLAWYFRAASGEGGRTGHPPIADYNFRPGKIGQAIKLDTEHAAEFFAKMTTGALTANDMQIAPGG